MSDLTARLRARGYRTALSLEAAAHIEALEAERASLIEAALDHRATASRALGREQDARAVIAEARKHLGGYILQESQDGGTPDPEVVAADDALSRVPRGAEQGDVETSAPNFDTSEGRVKPVDESTEGAAEPSARCEVCGLVAVAERGDVCRTCAEDGPAGSWTDPEPMVDLYSTAGRHARRSDCSRFPPCEERPRTREQYDAEEGNHA